jgi:hypothetical protein
MVIPLEEAPTKVRTGPPLDAAKDYALDIWAGVLPLRLDPQVPVPDPRLGADIPVPEHVRRSTPRSNKSPA